MHRALQVNHTFVPSTRELLNYFSPAPDSQYQMYWCAHRCAFACRVICEVAQLP